MPFSKFLLPDIGSNISMNRSSRTSFVVPGFDAGRAPRKPAAKPRAHPSRPRFALEGHEDEVYHERQVPGLEYEPEYCAFLGRSWTFNRAMQWIEPGNGTLICCSSGGRAELTGEGRVSDWFSDPVNSIDHFAGKTSFTVKSKRRLECIVMPGLQFHRLQHQGE